MINKRLVLPAFFRVIYLKSFESQKSPSYLLVQSFLDIVK